MNQVTATSREEGNPGHDVSVAIATYNGAAYLPELLDSILAQTVPPKEIVCADDASDDETVEILERYASTSPVPFKIIRHERNIGVIENFLSAFRATTGSLIAYCDQDDVWLDRKLEVCVKVFRDEVVSFASHASLVTDAQLNETGEVYYQINRSRQHRFPAVSFKMHCWGHQMIFSKPSLDLLLQLYECDTFRKTTLGTCFDYGIPFAASLVGDLYSIKHPLIKFRRHASATSKAAVAPHVWGNNISGRIVNRHARTVWRRDVLNSALSVLMKCSFSGAKAIEASRRAHEGVRDIAAQRIHLGSAKSIAGRIARLPKLAASLIRNRSYDSFQFKDLAADFLTVIYAGQIHRPDPRL